MAGFITFINLVGALGGMATVKPTDSAFEVNLLRTPEAEPAAHTPRTNVLGPVFLVLLGVLVGGALVGGILLFTGGDSAPAGVPTHPQPGASSRPPLSSSSPSSSAPLPSVASNTSAPGPAPDVKPVRLDAVTVRLAMLALGVDELHPAPFSSSPPVLLVQVLDQQEVFGVQVEDGEVTVESRVLDNPDVTLSLYASEVLALDPDHYLEGLKEMYQNKRLGVKYHRNQAELALKGYAGLASKFE